MSEGFILDKQAGENKLGVNNTPLELRSFTGVNSLEGKCDAVLRESEA